MRFLLILAMASLLGLSACVTPPTTASKSITITQLLSRYATKVASYGEWKVYCDKVDNSCRATMIITNNALDSKGAKEKTFAIISVFLFPGNKPPAAGFHLMMPPNSSIDAGVNLSVDGAPYRRYPISICYDDHCIARIGFTKAGLQSLKRGRLIKLKIVDSAAPNTPYYIFVPLDGFSKALADARKRNG